jgi:hypothetical protein
MKSDCDENTQSVLATEDYEEDENEKHAIIACHDKNTILNGLFQAFIFVALLYVSIVHIGSMSDFQVVSSSSRRLEDSQVANAQFRAYTSQSRDDWNPYIVDSSCPLYVICSTGNDR